MTRRLNTAVAILTFSFLTTGLTNPGLVSSATRLVAATANAQSLGSSQVPPEDEARPTLARDLTTRLVEMSARYQLASKADRSSLKEDLRDLAARRRQMLEVLIDSDPGELLRVALPDDLRSGLPSYLRDSLEQRVEVEGELEVLYQCGEEEARLSYFINSDGERLSVHFATSPSADLHTGALVRVKGVRVGQAVAVESDREDFQTSANSGFETLSMAVAPNTFGEQKVLVLLVNFQDKQTQPFSVSQVQSTVFGTVNNFYKESSYQQTWLTGDVYGWYTLPINSTCDTSMIGLYARQAATAAGINLSAYNRHVYAFPSVSCGWTGSGQIGGNPSQCWINGSMTLRTVGHELGHNLGLYHARAMDCHPNIVGSSCAAIEYGDSLDILGQSGVTGHSHANQKERLGWLNYGSSPGITTVQTSGTYWIDPYETVGSSPKALKILKSTDPTTGKKTWYYVEFRRPIGFDSFISSNSNVMNGVMVHTGTEGYSVDDYLLDMTPASSSFGDAALMVAHSYNDPNINVTLTPLSVDNTGAAVSVTFGPQPCVRANPSIVLSPSASQWVAAGSSVTYQVSVTNNDSNGCTASNFNLQSSVPSGWTTVFGNSTLNVNPSGNATTTMTITSPSWATDGFYSVPIAAANSGDPTYLATNTVTCVIVSSLAVGVSTDRSSYTRTQTVTVTATVNALASPVLGATVSFTMTKSNGAVVRGTATTGANGTAVFTYRFNKKQDPIGTYQVAANANLNGVTGGGQTSFGVR
jgi:hypothetical protein